jgi:UDP-N-acetylmuramoyl-L-alanyl-D-glutamate--2,6-diaminopimelate ligase
VFDYVRAIPADERVVYSQNAEGRGQEAASELWIVANEFTHSPSGLQFAIDTPFGKLAIESPLVGAYNVSNILAAVGAGLGRRIPFEAMQQGVKMTRGIIGRMERINFGQPFTVIVDFAHTPNALERALETARELTTGRVIVVFGCAGLRDVQKRAWMGEIAGRLADITVVTAEDPRTERLDAINAEIARGLESTGRRKGAAYFIVDDRAAAIEFAIRDLAQPGDLVLITGKGHERSMCYGTTEYPWSDQEAVRRALQKISTQRREGKKGNEEIKGNEGGR